MLNSEAVECRVKGITPIQWGNRFCVDGSEISNAIIALVLYIYTLIWGQYYFRKYNSFIFIVYASQAILAYVYRSLGTSVNASSRRFFMIFRLFRHKVIPEKLYTSLYHFLRKAVRV